MLNFDYLIISDQTFNIQSIRQTVDFFVALGIRRFIFLMDFDLTRYPVSWIVPKIRKLRVLLNSIRPRGIAFYVCADVLLSEEILYNHELYRLRVSPHSNLLFLKYPLFSNATRDTQLDCDINYLLYKQHLNPIFTSFEQNIKTNDSKRIAHALHVKSYRFCIDLNFLTSVDGVQFLEALSPAYPVIYPYISNSLSDYAGIEKAFSYLSAHLATSSFIQLFRTIQQNGHRLFSAL